MSSFTLTWGADWGKSQINKAFDNTCLISSKLIISFANLQLPCHSILQNRGLIGHKRDIIQQYRKAFQPAAPGLSVDF